MDSPFTFLDSCLSLYFPDMCPEKLYRLREVAKVMNAKHAAVYKRVRNAEIRMW